MKKLLFLVGVILVMLMSSCSFENYSTMCPTYSQHNKTTKHGEKAQLKYAKRN